MGTPSSTPDAKARNETRMLFAISVPAKRPEMAWGVGLLTWPAIHWSSDERMGLPGGTNRSMLPLVALTSA